MKQTTKKTKLKFDINFVDSIIYIYIYIFCVVLYIKNIYTDSKTFI